MPDIPTQEKAVRLIKAMEADGRTIGRVVVEGRRVELVFAEAEKQNVKEQDARDAFEMVDFGKG